MTLTLDRLSDYEATWEGVGLSVPGKTIQNEARKIADLFPDRPPRVEIADGGICLYWGQPFGGVVIGVTVKASGGFALGRVGAPAIVSGAHYKRRDALIKELRLALRELDR